MTVSGSLAAAGCRLTPGTFIIPGRAQPPVVGGGGLNLSADAGPPGA
jgi:hypothetical protein